MKVLKVRISGLSMYQSDLDIDFYASQRNSEESKQELMDINGKVFANPVIEFAGLNGSGKTVTLNLLVFILSMLNGNPLNGIGMYFNKIKGYMDRKPFTSEVWYFLDGDIIHLKTIIGMGEDLDQSGEDRLIILDEELSRYTRKQGGKVDWLDPAKYRTLEMRPKDNPYLPQDVSMNGALVTEKEKRIRLINDIPSTQNNRMLLVQNIPVELIRFLDPNIEKLEVNGGNDVPVSIKLKFRNRKSVLLNDMEEVFNYLSSGTIKGLRIFTMAYQILRQGGYLIVDELENHFNLEIVKTLVRFFQDKKVNKGNGTLLFSTHYPELMDLLTRNDSVYILKNNGGISCVKASEKLKRNDGIKKSEAFIHDYFDGTAPDYEAYMDLKERLQTK